MPTTIIREIQPLALHGQVTDSVVTWSSRDDDCEAHAETSLDDGATWSRPHLAGPVPGLSLASPRPDAVRARLIMHWENDRNRKSYPFGNFNVRIACDTAHYSDEVGAAQAGEDR